MCVCRHCIYTYVYMYIWAYVWWCPRLWQFVQYSDDIGRNCTWQFVQYGDDTDRGCDSLSSMGMTLVGAVMSDDEPILWSLNVISFHIHDYWAHS